MLICFRAGGSQTGSRSSRIEVGVTIFRHTTDHTHLVTGYPDGSATIWTVHTQEVRIYAYCTNNLRDAYWG